jgi:hypothetical protein
MYILAALLVGGFICNFLVRPVAAKWLMSDAELEIERKLAHDSAAKEAIGGDATMSGRGSHRGLVVGAWLLVSVPLVYGIWNTVINALVLFG